MKNNPTIYIILIIGRDGTRASLMRRRRDKARDLRARAAATPPRLAGDLGGLEAAKRHGHAERGATSPGEA